MMLLEPMQMPDRAIRVNAEEWWIKPAPDKNPVRVPADKIIEADDALFLAKDVLEQYPELALDKTDTRKVGKVEHVRINPAYKEKYGLYEIGPMEQGFATTLGNSLRRVLLSSIQGAAVRYVKVEGLHHEFTAIDGGDIDYIDLILKLKKLVFKVSTLEEVKLTLDHEGTGPVTAADIKDTEYCRILNKELYFFDMNEDKPFHMEIWVGVGRGYVPADRQDMENKPVGVIPVDSIYSPVQKVNFTAGQQRVGERIDFDRLTMEIWTNTSIEPRSSLYLAAKILKDFFLRIAQFDEEPEYVEDIQMDPELEHKEKLLNMNVKDLELTVRSSNCLAAAKIETVGELVSKTEHEMLKYRNFGKKSLDEITLLLDKYDLHLGMDVEAIFEQIEEAKKRVTKAKKG